MNLEATIDAWWGEQDPKEVTLQNRPLTKHVLGKPLG